MASCYLSLVSFLFRYLKFFAVSGVSLCIKTCIKTCIKIYIKAYIKALCATPLANTLTINRVMTTMTMSGFLLIVLTPVQI